MHIQIYNRRLTYQFVINLFSLSRSSPLIKYILYVFLYTLHTKVDFGNGTFS